MAEPSLAPCVLCPLGSQRSCGALALADCCCRTCRWEQGCGGETTVSDRFGAYCSFYLHNPTHRHAVSLFPLMEWVPGPCRHKHRPQDTVQSELTYTSRLPHERVLSSKGETEALVSFSFPNPVPPIILPGFAQSTSDQSQGHRRLQS